jgi:D-alanine-D-alanine ligase
MIPAPRSAATASLTQQLADLRAWADSTLSQLSVALVYGGISAEDQLYISKSPPEQLSVTALSQTLTQLGIRYEVLDPCQPSFIRNLTRFDVVLPNLHGPFGEDGRLQGLLDYLRVPYCGSGVAASATAADKISCKRLMEALAIPTPPWRIWPGPEPAWLGRPVMVKPRTGGSSVGMSLVRREEDLADAITSATSGDLPGVLIEDHIPGLPVTVGVLELPTGPTVFPPLATQVHGAEFYDADAKLDTAAEAPVTCTDAALPVAVTMALNSHVMRLWDGLGCHGMARADFIVAGDGAAVFALEVNTTPGMSRESNFVTAAGLLGLGHADTVIAILHEALTRRRYDAPLPVPDLTSPPLPHGQS